MLVCQVLLTLFTAQWLMSQYSSHEEELKKNLTKIFSDVQNQVSDSLLLTQVIDPATAMPTAAPAKEKQAAGKPLAVALSPKGLHKVLAGASSLSADEQQHLFHIDTIVFNEMFAQQLKQNGLNFQSSWINNNDSNKDGKNIFIKSDFFTQENGVLVKNYSGYLFWMLLPQLLFVCILLSLTTTAFFITFRSLQAQVKLSQMKDDFISNMSHELKTPISTVKLALEAMRNFGVIDNPQQTREYLGMASSEMDRLELLATRVLNTSLLESGNMSLQRTTYNLKQLVQETLQNMQLRFEQTEAHISFTSTGNNFMVPVDKLHIQGVLVNLLDNSLKYAVATPNIQITLSEHNGIVQLQLADDGPGIPEEYREKVFEKFFRIPNGLKHNIKGYGLGLSYATQVMRQHNGSIGVNNIATGGCMFTLTF